MPLSKPCQCTSLNSLCGVFDVPFPPQDDVLALCLPPKEHSDNRIVMPIVGDGNCFYRAVSMYIFRTERYHANIRRSVVAFMFHHPELFSTFVEDMDYDIYLTLMSETTGSRHSWGTHREIFAVATMINAPVYVYSMYGDKMKWLLNKPLQSLTAPIIPYITLKLQSEHFETVFPKNFVCYCSIAPPVLRNRIAEPESPIHLLDPSEFPPLGPSSSEHMPFKVVQNRKKSKKTPPHTKQSPVEGPNYRVMQVWG